MCSEFHRGQRLPSFNKRPDICMQLSFEVELTLPCNAGRSIYVTEFDLIDVQEGWVARHLSAGVI